MLLVSYAFFSTRNLTSILRNGQTNTVGFPKKSEAIPNLVALFKPNPSSSCRLPQQKSHKQPVTNPTVLHQIVKPPAAPSLPWSPKQFRTQTGPIGVYQSEWCVWKSCWCQKFSCTKLIPQPKFNIAPENFPSLKRKVVFQIFQLSCFKVYVQLQGCITWICLKGDFVLLCATVNHQFFFTHHLGSVRCFFRPSTPPWSWRVRQRAKPTSVRIIFFGANCCQALMSMEFPGSLNRW